MRIVLTASARSKPEKTKKYKDSLKGADGNALDILDAHPRVATRPAGWRDLLASADGLVLTGGADVEPARYGEDVDPRANVRMDLERDEMEWGLLDAAHSGGIPVLAICRGHQLVNAYLGGALWQDLAPLGPDTQRRHDTDDSDRRRLAHGLDVGPGSHPLNELFRAFAPFEVNSLHHQAVRELGGGLEVVATSPDGVIEAMAWRDPSWWLWGVQWHPEELTEPDDHPIHRELFRRFLQACDESR